MVSAAATAVEAGAPADPRAELTRILRTPRVLADLPLKVAAYAVRNTDRSKVRVIMAAELGSGGLEPADYNVGFEDHGRAASPSLVVYLL